MKFVYLSFHGAFFGTDGKIEQVLRVDLPRRHVPGGGYRRRSERFREIELQKKQNYVARVIQLIPGWDGQDIYVGGLSDCVDMFVEVMKYRAIVSECTDEEFANTTGIPVDTQFFHQIVKGM